MKGAKRILLIVGVLCVGIGLGLAFFAAAKTGFNFKKFSDTSLEEKTHSITEPFHSIEIQGAAYDVNVVPSDGEVCQVVCMEGEDFANPVTVEGDILRVNLKGSRSWYDPVMWFDWGRGSGVTVYLPRGEYESLLVSTMGGDIFVPEGFDFSSVRFNSASGEITFQGNAREELFAQSVSGEVSLKNSQAAGVVKASTTSGEISLEKIAAGDIALHSVSGDVDMKNTLAQKSMEITTTSGQVYFSACDGAKIKIETVSGDVNGSLRSEKQFFSHTVSGSVYLPNATSDSQTCDVTTTSGDIEIKIQ